MAIFMQFRIMKETYPGQCLVLPGQKDRAILLKIKICHKEGEVGGREITV